MTHHTSCSHGRHILQTYCICHFIPSSFHMDTPVFMLLTHVAFENIPLCFDMIFNGLLYGNFWYFFAFSWLLRWMVIHGGSHLTILMLDHHCSLQRIWGRQHRCHPVESSHKIWYFAISDFFFILYVVYIPPSLHPSYSIAALPASQFTRPAQFRNMKRKKRKLVTIYGPKFIDEAREIVQNRILTRNKFSYYV